MGASASINTIVTNINNRVEQQLIQNASASANATCTVTINSIKFEETNGCGIKVSNLCSADATAQVEAIVNASIDFYNSLTTTQKQEAPALLTAALGINTTVTNLTTDFKNYIEQKCLSEALINSNMTINDITVKKCTAPPNQGPLMFEFINSGKATGQCAIGALVDIQVAGSNAVANAQSQGFNWSSVIWPVVVLGIFIALFFLLYYLKGVFVVKPADKFKLELAKHNSTYANLILLDDYLKKKKTDTVGNIDELEKLI